jgi:hypothetical protein
MDSGRTAQLVEEIVDIAGKLRSDVQEDHESRELFREISTLRRSVETLEREVRGDQWSTQGDAC